MKALIKYDNRDGAVRLAEVEEPEINDDEVLVKIKYAGICGSDPHIYHQNISYNINVPIILGHEFSGEIVKVGKNVKKWKLGDRVTAETHADYCNKCILCKMGHYHLCRDRKGYGFHVNGVFSEFVKVNQRILHKLPENVSFKEGAAVEPLCVVYNAIINNSSFSRGSSVMVIGPGAIGSLSALLVDILGSDKVIVVGTKMDEYRLKRLMEIKKFETIFNDDINGIKNLKECINDGYGFDLVIDSVGSSETLKLAMDMVRPDGEILKIGWGPKPLNYSIDPIVGKSVKLIGSFSHFWPVWEKCLQLCKDKKIDLNKIITHEITLDEWKSGFEMVENLTGLKVVFKM